MPKFFVYHKHTPGNHAEMSAAWDRASRATGMFTGQVVYCSCPSGKHEVLAVLTADSQDAVEHVAPPAIRGELTISELIEEVI
jgi:hypothetical protein